MKKSTQCVHSGSLSDNLTGGIVNPIFTSTSFAYLDTDDRVYTRYFNAPNQRAVIEKLCSLEGAEDGLLFSSGMAAISTVVFSQLSSGDHIVLQNEIYGGTHHFMTEELNRFGIEYSFVSCDPESFQEAIKENTKLIFIETPTNPLLSITDINAVAGIAKDRNIITAIDNTYASPINQNPMGLGIDIVIHSGTKYLGGHSDISCGAALSTKTITDKIRNLAMSFGGNLNATTCYLLERSLKTLGIRVEKQTQNAQRIAEAIQSNRNINRIYYPGLENHPGHIIAKKQMNGFGAMFSFEINEEQVKPASFIRQLKLIKLAMSLGGVESIICSPATTSHQKLSDREREQLGITDGLFRLSVGIEDADDLIDDIEQALTA